MTYDHNRDHYRFQRTQRLYTPPLETSAPLKAWLNDVMELAGMALSIGGFMLLCVLLGAKP